MNDRSLMPFGKFKGSPLEDVSANYLLWLYDNPTGLWCDNLNPGTEKSKLKQYIEDNWTSLEKEAPDYLAKNRPSKFNY